MRIGGLRLAHAAVAILLALGWAGVLADRHIEGRASFLDRIEAPLLDLRFALSGPRPAPPDIVIVALDDETVRLAGRYPVPRSTIAQLIRRLNDLRAAAIGIDILFLDRGDSAEDALLEQALKDTQAVIAAAATFSEAGQAGLAMPETERLLLPSERFRHASSVGIVNVATDQGGTPRHVPLAVNGPDGLLLSFPMRLAARAGRKSPALSPNLVRIGPTASATDLGWSLPLRFYGPRGAIATLSASTLLQGGESSEAIAGRIVLIGATALGTADTFATPFDPVLPGVEVLATATAHLRHGDGLVRDGRVRRADAVAAFGLSVTAAIGFVFLPPGASLLLAVLLASAWLAATVFGFGAGYWLSAILPLAAMAPGIVFGLLGRQALDRIRTRRLTRSEEALRRFQAPALAARIARDPEYLAAPVSQEAVIIFLDLNGFTSASEELGPARTRDMLKEFHAVLSTASERRRGVVMNFMGDGAMILFGVPDPEPDDAERGLFGAVELVEAVRAWLAGRAQDLGQSLGIRVGAHYGPVVLSRLGSSVHEQITATGDCVNVASRLLEVAKQFGAALVVSGDLIRAAGEPVTFTKTIEGRRPVDIRGRQKSLEIAYRWAEIPPASAEASAPSETGLADRCQVPVIGAAAAPEDAEARKGRAEPGVVPSERDGIA